LEDADLVPFAQEVTDTRFMVVCFQEPIFNLEMVEKDMPGTVRSAPAPPVVMEQEAVMDKIVTVASTKKAKKAKKSKRL